MTTSEFSIETVSSQINEDLQTSNSGFRMIQVAPSVAKLRLDMPLTIAKGADPISRFSPIT